MKWNKQAVSLILSGALAISAVPAGLAADMVEYISHNVNATIVDSGTCGENTTWTLDSEGTMTIEGSGTISDSDYFRQNRDAIRNIVICPGVTGIGTTITSAWIFSSYNNLESVTIPDSVAYIGLGVFNDCAKLTEINVAPENAYYSSIDGVLFNRDKTTLVMYPKGKGDSYTVPDGVTTIGTYAFAWSDIADVTLPDSLTNIGPWAFICCYDLTKVTIPAHVTSLDIGAFHGCTSLSEIYFTGDAPEMYEHDINMDPEAYAASFKRVTATAYYPKDASGWEDVLTKDYTGPEGKLTWVAYDPDADNPTPPTPVSDIFQDITPNAWYTDAVQYVYDNGIMKGMGNGTFAPGESMTRAMVAQILYAQAGSPAVSGDIPFTDVPAGKWYSDAILWANQNDVVAGMGDGTFAPSANITRQEYAAILYRYEKSPTVSGSLDFLDADTVSGWATDAVLWATQNGIINGTANNGVTLLDPKGTATRAQSAVILKGYLEK